MNREILLRAFKEILNEFPALPPGKAKEVLLSEAQKKNYDLQDEAFIEKALEDETRPIESYFRDAMLDYLQKNDLGDGLDEFLGTDEGTALAVGIFLTGLEKAIDFYYNAVIAMHFSTS